LGLLVKGPVHATVRKLKELIRKEKPPRIISVGDVISDVMIKHSTPPQILVVDNKVMRKLVEPVPADVDRTVYVNNPPGTLSDEAWAAVQEAVQRTERIRVLVDGEEDLLTLVAVLYAPKGSFVVYGQPDEGIVIIKVTERTREKIRKLVEAMETEL
jgi:hypothetical protein